MPLEALLESILFWRGEPLAVTALAKLAAKPLSEVETALTNLTANLNGRGVQLVRSGETVTLGTHPAAAELLNNLQKEELAGELGGAALETLATVVYRAPVSRAEVDYIRGVNSSYILRQLAGRGLIERVNTKDARGYAYQPTIQFLQHLGLTRWSELPDYESARAKLEAFATTATGEKS